MPAAPTTGVHLWSARLDRRGGIAAGELPADERDRAGRLVRPEARRRRVAARWALREVLGRYLRQEPAQIELRLGAHGKPALADPEAALRFNLSHSDGLALIAVCSGREVGIDLERVGSKPAGFYTAWTRREAIAKCLGTGLWAPLPDDPVAVSTIEAEPGFAAAIAVRGDSLPPIRRLSFEPGKVPG